MVAKARDLELLCEVGRLPLFPHLWYHRFCHTISPQKRAVFSHSIPVTVL